MKNEGKTMEIKSKEEIEHLCENWKLDPIWDIEETEGFEDYKQELLIFRLETEKEWREAENKRLLEKSKVLGCSVELIRYIEKLESAVENLTLRAGMH